ncbi:MAG: small multi-drug export protein [Candidatus Magasanikbacteria bacterium]|nr:small multi-drug export protein [Candidatus Magasanikbacteria bacterium]
MLGMNPALWFSQLPPEWGVFLLSMIPITELRAAIPIGIEVYKLSVIQTWVIAVLGNMVPTTCILLILPYMHEWLLKQKFVGSVLKKKLADAEKYFKGNYAKYGSIALVVFVGIPLPLTGAWTGSLAAFVFNIPFKKSWPLIFAGVCIAATIVVIVTVSAGGFLRAIL